MTRRVLVTGSSGLVGSEVVVWFQRLGFAVHGIDNNRRAVFFGAEGDTRGRQQQLQALEGFSHHELDVRDRQGLAVLVKQLRPSLIVHAAAQPSHDLATTIPCEDFDTNAVGTLNLLEAARQYCPEAPLVFLSTNKVYGDRPNTLPLVELETRWEFADPVFQDGIEEDFPIDQSLHSLFGGSKLAADIMVQEYGRYFGMPTCCLRGGCLTGPHHRGVELHGFLNYLVKCHVAERDYTVFGYRGKQVRDILHAEDVARFIQAFWDAPRCGEVYNLGGGKGNSCSLMEAIALIEACSGKKQRTLYEPQPRRGDHLCYYSNLGKVKRHYPQWHVSRPLPQIVAEMVTFHRSADGAGEPA